MAGPDPIVTGYLWLDLDPRPAAEQMALDTAMVTVARESGASLLRVYRWRGDSVSFGAHEAAATTWDRDRLERDGIPCVRRPTGGRAVWHGATDLTYAWAGPAAGPAEVRRIYRDLHERLARAIATPDRALALAEERRLPGLAPGACFDVPVGGEVLLGARKAIGSAQRVYGDHLLQHGAIAIEERGPELARYRRGGVVATRAGSDPLAPAPETAGAIAAAWHAEGAVVMPPELTSRIVLASVEHHSHYRDPTWTWRR